MIDSVVNVGLEKSKLEHLSEVICRVFRISQIALKSNLRRRELVNFLTSNYSTISIAIEQAHNHLKHDKEFIGRYDSIKDKLAVNISA